MYNGFIDKIREGIHRIKGTYLGKSGSELYDNLDKVFKSGHKKVLIETPDRKIRGRMINYEPGAGFNMDTFCSDSAGGVLTVKLEDVMRAYLVK